MATGFVERFKGKYTSDPNTTRVAGIPMYGPATEQTLTPTSTGSTVTVGTVTVARVNASSTTAFIRLPGITFVGQPLAIEIFGVGSTSTANFITAAPGQTFSGSSYSVMRSTQNITLELQATSSVNWAVMGTFSTTVTYYAPSLSTTT
jgi:hypothetical protein